jgi:Rrf2 family transcriptional regulator, iron-sulfur cluster assembly transcription factor
MGQFAKSFSKTMRISAQEEYGLRCLMQVAVAPGPRSLRQVAEREGISAAYAGKLLWILSRAGLVKSVRGPKGGYTLGRPASEIPLSDVIKVLDEDNLDQHCQHFPGDQAVCVHTGDCTIMPIVQGLHTVVRDVLSQISLEQLLSGEAVAMAQLTRIKRANNDRSRT